MVNLPAEYIKNMQELLGDEYSTYEESFSNGRSYGLRVNTNKIAVEDFLKICPFDLEPIPWTENGFYYREDEKPSKHPFYYAGLYYLQEPSAMLPAAVLPILPGDVVFDGCAAPGGKSTQLSLKLNGEGVLVSNDISASRCQGLLKNLELFGVNNAVICSEDLIKLQKQYFETFDKILIDAPCSGEGMFRKDSGLITSWKQRGNEYYANIQKSIVESALNMLKPGGMLVYSTCTFSKMEDEDILEYMFSICPNLKLLPIKKCEGFKPGLGRFEQAVRLYPHQIKGEGHFVALVQKGEELNNERYYSPIIDLKEVDEFFKHVTTTRFKGTVKKIKEKMILHTPFDSNGLRLLRNGLLLGNYNKANIFEPSQALALALKKEEFDQCIDLRQDDIRVIKYLKCETIDVSEFDFSGWVLVCVEGYPLGFGKMNNGIFKNKYDKNWRYL